MNEINNIVPALWSGGREVAKYSAAIIDLWGVVHDGYQPYPKVIDTMHKMRAGGLRILLLSNSPRRSKAVIDQLRTIGIPDTAYDHLVSSGELVYLALEERAKKFGSRFYYKIAPQGVDYLTPDLTDIREMSIDKADYILLIGPENDECDRVEDYDQILTHAAYNSLPVICANPDFQVMRGGRLVLCAGAIAKRYEDIGGKVQIFGKPNPLAYVKCLSLVPDLRKDQLIAVGDSPVTDVAGALAQDIDVLFIAGGLHKEELIVEETVDLNAVVKLFRKHKVDLPLAVASTITW